MTEENFFGLSAGYIERGRKTMPRQGAAQPWRMHQNYARDFAALKLGRVDDGVLRFSGKTEGKRAA